VTSTGSLALHLPPAAVLEVFLVELIGLVVVSLAQVVLRRQHHKSALALVRAANGAVSIVIHADGGIEIRHAAGRRSEPAASGSSSRPST